MALARFDTWVRSAVGPAAAGASVYICSQPAFTSNVPPSPLVQLYSDNAGANPIAQPLVADGFGHAYGYCSAGTYTVVVVGGGIVQQVFPDQLIGNTTVSTMLFTNGVPNTVQSSLNIQGTGVSSDSTGDVTIAGTVLETNGITNPVQSLLNLSGINGVAVTADGAGDVTISGPSFSGNGSFFYGAGIRDLGVALGMSGAPAANSVNGIATANLVSVYLFELDVATTISKASTYCTNNSIGPTATFGVYSLAGAKLVDGGSFTTLNSAGVQTNSFTPVTLQPGTYWHAQACTTNTGACTFIGIVTGSVGAGALYAKNYARACKAANALVGGVLPATLGVLTPFTPISGDGDGFCCPLYE